MVSGEPYDYLCSAGSHSHEVLPKRLWAPLLYYFKCEKKSLFSPPDEFLNARASLRSYVFWKPDNNHSFSNLTFDLQIIFAID